MENLLSNRGSQIMELERGEVEGDWKMVYAVWKENVPDDSNIHLYQWG